MEAGFIALVALSVLKGISLLLSYITNNAFPQPLSEEEEQKYLELWQQGDQKARNILIEHNLRLVAHITKKFENTGEDNDDLISIGTVGLIKAINTYNMNKGTKLATYAARCIENEILMHLRAMKKTRGEVSLYDPIGTDKEGNEIALIDILGSDQDVAEMVETSYERQQVMQKVNVLTPREKKVLVMRFGLFHGLRRTQRDIARKMGISRSYVSRIEKPAHIHTTS
ncbi:MAG: polymerase sporulation-specific sigma factor [Moorella sp. (in: firmicutes)]|uniref:RNA polymerase sigma-28 factor n=1 Tax=Moorella mulderi DSM 14980 TaxID=1122241 RepID=A0A151ASJ6_9FIRM|nr:RNA polymerase sporulation sigma factor SigK [Moorella mulderi]KYH30621.1 RNA polymerase sigma-28 factor precursor [Moorella mulderi DSM 14980]MDK2816278.1 polymerase sporulation-specific sigma factor [Moorella sp. (in: firmicutes)]